MERNLNHLRFAANMILISKSPEELQQLINQLGAASNSVGLKLNQTKTKVM